MGSSTERSSSLGLPRPLLSVLSLSTTDRVAPFLCRLAMEMRKQMEGHGGAEWLCLVDDYDQSVGVKWNALIAAAKGEYITVIGDDDLPSRDYISRLTGAIAEFGGVDCIVFDTEMYRDGEFVATVKWGLEHEYRDDLDNKLMWRYPGELMAIRSDIRKRFPYPDKFRGSDWVQARRMRHALETQHRIDKVLYRYYSRSDNDTHIKMQIKMDNERREYASLRWLRKDVQDTAGAQPAPEEVV